MKNAFSLVSIGFVGSRILAGGRKSKTILCVNKLNVRESKIKENGSQEAFRLPFANCDALIFYTALMPTGLSLG